MPPTLLPDFFTRRLPVSVTIRAVFFALFTAVLVACALAFRRIHGATSAMRAMLCIVLLVYAFAGVELAVDAVLLAKTRHGTRVCVDGACATLQDVLSRDQYISLMGGLELAACGPELYISDVIVVWRAWKLWRGSVLVLATSALLLAGNLAIIVLCFVPSPVAITRKFIFPGTEAPLPIALTLAISLATNVWTTALVAVRAYSAIVRRFSSQWRDLLLFFMSMFGGAGKWSHANLYFNCTIVYLAGMYPATVFLLVTLQMSASEVFASTIGGSMRTRTVDILDDVTDDFERGGRSAAIDTRGTPFRETKYMTSEDEIKADISYTERIPAKAPHTEDSDDGVAHSRSPDRLGSSRVP
ncbi:hypothetical protein K488DRAFT_74422 [Vararia minispora EC-137]|uniref:Uncharacterized protein n=1 Tax=Vararia minispora EC-137 TaxID=1314806 RepID=A0ACB8Q741_9AGAM|nr:hypothetical protein K488DRAFT_74422 [Vararia minispora EC-137]